MSLRVKVWWYGGRVLGWTQSFAPLGCVRVHTCNEFSPHPVGSGSVCYHEVRLVGKSQKEGSNPLGVSGCTRQDQASLFPPMLFLLSASAQAQVLPTLSKLAQCCFLSSMTSTRAAWSQKLGRPVRRCQLAPSSHHCRHVRALGAWIDCSDPGQELLQAGWLAACPVISSEQRLCAEDTGFFRAQVARHSENQSSNSKPPMGEAPMTQVRLHKCLHSWPWPAPQKTQAP